MKSDHPELDWLCDPRVFAVNREEAHSDHLFYTSLEQAEQEREMPLRQSLNGRWKFCYTENPALRPSDFYQEGYDCSSWPGIEVPGHIQLQGWGKPQYVNTIYPWDGREDLYPPQIPKEYNPVGSYTREFSLDPDLHGKKVYLSFQGVETAFYVWLNGAFVGYSEDSFTPAEFEITPYLREGTNRIAVEVYRFSTASWIQDQDFWRFSGIFRDVFLYAVPRAHVRDLFVTTALRDGGASAEIRAKMKLQLESGAVFADAVLQNDRGEVVASRSDIPCKVVTEFTLSVSAPHLWSAEDPYLYRLLIHLHDEQGNTLEAVPQRVGVREFCMKDGIMCLNGKRIVFKGVNRHEFNCRRGRAITKEDMLWDIRFLKQNNINAVRTCHYPNQSEWYRLCDEYGIYLIDETNLESHGTWQYLKKRGYDYVVPGDREEWLDAVLDRANSMLQRDKNHPSVLIWSCGNESYGGRDIYEMSRYFHKNDPTRLVHYEGVFQDRRYNETSDMESRMYAKPAEIREYLESNPEKPYISCEYMHAMGNSCGGMHLYTELEQYPKYQGGFIWDYIDQAILTKDASGREVMAYGGDFQDRATNFNFCTNGIVYANREPSPKVQEVRFLYQNIKLIPDRGGVLVKNENLFVSTDDYVLEYRLLHNGEPVFSAVTKCSVPAGEERYFPLTYPRPHQSGEYALNCSLVHKSPCRWAQAGDEQAFGQFIWQCEEPEQKRNTEAFRPLTVVSGDENIGVHGQNLSVLFSIPYGGIVSLRRNGEEYVNLPPRPVYWRAATDNDRGNGYLFRCAPWYAAGQGQRCAGVHVTEQNGTATVTYEYELPVPGTVKVTTAYTVSPDGTILVHVVYPGAKNLPELPLFGLGFQLRKAYHRFRYYGMGPEENYIDRMYGAHLGIFEGTAEGNLSQYLVPQECGNRTGVRWAEITSDSGKGLLFESVGAPFELGVLPYTAYELEHAAHLQELPEPALTSVRILAKQMGVGGDDSWGAPVHEEFRIPSEKPLELTFQIRTIG